MYPAHSSFVVEVIYEIVSKNTLLAKTHFSSCNPETTETEKKMKGLIVKATEL